MWPEKIEEIIKRYYQIQKRSINGTLSTEQKKQFVNELIFAYNSLDHAERVDVLIPAKWQFLADRAIASEMGHDGDPIYEINYKWPLNNGFAGAYQKITLKPNDEYDRIGGKIGRFIAPLPKNGVPTSFLERAIPYYIPETDITKSPAYHRYRIVSQYSRIEKSEERSGMKKEDIFVLQGEIAHAFWRNPDDGGGIQVRIPKGIDELEREGVFYEI